MRQQIQIQGFWWAAALCLALGILKLTGEVHWSWWRVLLPLWVFLGHNALYITVGFVWISFVERGSSGEEATIRQDRDSYGYQLGAMRCVLIFLDNLLKRIEGTGNAAWFWLSSGRMELIFVFGILCVVCQVLFWSEVVRTAMAAPAASSSPQSKFPLVEDRGEA
jgi:hypothetical protein